MKINKKKYHSKKRRKRNIYLISKKLQAEDKLIWKTAKNRWRYCVSA